jgi:hypothetical protein
MLHRLFARGRTDVAHWHEADTPAASVDVRFEGEADISQRFQTF